VRWGLIPRQSLHENTGGEPLFLWLPVAHYGDGREKKTEGNAGVSGNQDAIQFH
jgi:hypothetical protein